MPRFDAPGYYLYGGANPSTPTNVRYPWQIYSDRHDVQTSHSGGQDGVLDGTCSVANPGERPQASGYQLGERVFNPDQPADSIGSRIASDSAIVDSATHAHYDFAPPPPDFIHWQATLSNLVDTTGAFNTAKARFLSLPFTTWAERMYALSWRDVGVTFAPDCNAYDPSLYDGAEVLNRVQSANGPGTYPSVSGWNVQAPGVMSMWRGQARYVGGVPIEYWIGRWQFCHIAFSGEVRSRTTLVEQGMLPGSDSGVIVNLPFPDGGLPIDHFTQDLIFILIGQGGPQGLGDILVP